MIVNKVIERSKHRIWSNRDKKVSIVEHKFEIANNSAKDLRGMG